jgi:hypothetical protein
LNWHSPPLRGNQGFDGFNIVGVTDGTMSGFGQRELKMSGKGGEGICKVSRSGLEAVSLALPWLALTYAINHQKELTWALCLSIVFNCICEYESSASSLFSSKKLMLETRAAGLLFLGEVSLSKISQSSSSFSCRTFSI